MKMYTFLSYIFFPKHYHEFSLNYILDLNIGVTQSEFCFLVISENPISELFY